MHRFLKGLTATVAVGLVASLFSVSSVLAAEEARFPVMGAGESYISITNVVDDVPTVPLYMAEAPVTVTFHGDNLCRESIEYFTEGLLEDDVLYLPEVGDPVQFTVKNYTYFGETEVHDELTEEMWDIGVYVTGNYATLTAPGYYLVAAGPEAAAPTYVAIQIVAPSAGEPAPAPNTEPTTEPTTEPATEPTPVAQPEAVSALPTPSSVLVNGAAVAFEAYNIDGYNYFKLRDLAMALSGSAKQFEVTWDGEKNAINLISGMPYTAIGGELAVSDDPAVKQATPTAAKVYVNGAEVEFTAYNIGGYNYFKLRDIAKVIDFGVTWNAETSTIGIDPASSYTE